MDGRATMLLLMVLLSASLTMANLGFGYPDKCELCYCYKLKTGNLNCTCVHDQNVNLSYDIVSINVTRCSGLTLNTNGTLKNLTLLKTLTVSKVSFLTIQENSLCNVDTLVVQDVDTLVLETRALYGITIKYLRIINVVVRGHLKSDSLNLKDLTLLSLSNSTFTQVYGRAITAQMGTRSQFIVEDCRFETVESGGVLVTSASKATVVRSHFGSVKDDGFTLTARDSAVVNDNRFGNHRGLCITASQVFITSNSFGELPGCKNYGIIHLLRFQNNTVLQGPPEVPFFTITGGVYFVDNSFQCECNGNQQEKVFSDITRKRREENFCFSEKCPKSVSLAKFQRHLLDDKCAATCDDKKLCELQNNNSVTCNTVEKHHRKLSRSSAAHVLPLVATLLTVQLVAIFVI